jgi:hypothetical protein
MDSKQERDQQSYKGNPEAPTKTGSMGLNKGGELKKGQKQ